MKNIGEKSWDKISDKPTWRIGKGRSRQEANEGQN